MLKDIRELTDGSHLKADIVIIGGGMAGISFAQQWVGSDKTVLILESGGLTNERETQDLYKGTATLSGPNGTTREADKHLHTSRARFYGGSINWWSGVCVPIQSATFEPRPWLGEKGWPMRFEDLKPFYDRACDALSINRYDGTVMDILEQEGALIDLRGSEGLLNQAQQVSKVTKYSREHALAFVTEYLKAPNIAAYLYANATQFVVDDKHESLTHLNVTTLTKKRYKVTGKNYIMACGGIENARLLLASNQLHETKFGHRSDALGRYFQSHLRGYKERTKTIAGTDIHFSETQNFNNYLYRTEMKPQHVALVLSHEAQAKHQSCVTEISLFPYDERGVPDELAIRHVATRIDRQDYTLERGRHCVLIYDAEQLPNPESQVTLSENTDALGIPRVQLEWRFKNKDLKGLKNAIKGVACELGAASIGRLCFPMTDSELVTKTDFSAHHIGTTRMDDDPTLGIVDSNLKCHDVDNLYIVGSSVFPTSGAANPTLTIVALSIRLADHLKEKGRG